MKKIKRILSSFICLTSSILGLTIGLSSCVLTPNDEKNEDGSDDTIIKPPTENDNGNGSDDDNIEKPEEPEPNPEEKPPIDDKPEEPSFPENNNPITPPNSSLINNESIILEDYGNLLPSQYLLNINDENNLNIDKTKIKENFDSNKVSNTTYIVSSFNDIKGDLSIKMKYKNNSNNNIYEYTFNFKNLAKLEDQKFSLSFDIKNKNLLNAKEISDKLINNDYDAKNFFKYLDENGSSLIFKNGTNKLTLEYLSFENGLTLSGFNDKWYVSNDNLELNIQPKSLKINAYEKNNNSSKISIKKIEYPTNLVGSNGKPIILTCSSILDYLLEKIDANNDYKENKFASYYYYDITNNNGLKSQLQLTDGRWLKNVTNKFDNYDEKQYRPIFSKVNSPYIDNYGNLIIQIQMQIGDENIVSKNYKQLTIKSFLTKKDSLFYYNSGSKNNKFNLFCDAYNQDKIFDAISRHTKAIEIKKKIKESTNSFVNVSEYFNTLYYLLFKKNIKLYFGDSEIIKQESNNFFSSENEIISIEQFDINFDDVIIEYNKNNNHFQLKCKLIIACEGIDYESSTSDYMNVNITKINKPFI